MIDIKKEIQILLLRQGLSMSKMAKALEFKNNGSQKISIASMSRMFNTKTIKFEIVQEILNFLGYEIKIEKKSHKI